MSLNRTANGKGTSASSAGQLYGGPLNLNHQMHPALQKLQDGDRRSIGRSNEVVSEALSNPRLFRVVFSGLSADDPLVRMRSADVVEKITAQRPELLRSYKNRLIRDLAATDQKEVRWHVAQMLPRLELNDDERKRVLRVLFGYLNDSSGIVRTFAMQALADIARDSPAPCKTHYLWDSCDEGTRS